MKTTASSNIIKCTATQCKALMNKFLPTGNKITQSATVLHVDYGMHLLDGIQALLPDKVTVLQSATVNATVLQLLEQLNEVNGLTDEQAQMLLNMKAASNGTAKMVFSIDWWSIAETDIMQALRDVNNGITPYMVG